MLANGQEIKELWHVPTGSLLFNGGGDFDFKSSLKGIMVSKTEEYIVTKDTSGSYQFNVYDSEFNNIYSIAYDYPSSDKVTVNEYDNTLIKVYKKYSDEVNIKIYNLSNGTLENESNLKISNFSYCYPIKSCDDGIRFVVTGDSIRPRSSVIKIDKNNLQLIYEKNIKSYVGDIVLSEDNILALNDDEFLYKNKTDGRLYCLNASDGSKIKSDIYGNDSLLWATPYVDGNLFFADYDIYKVSINNGFNVIQKYSYDGYARRGAIFVDKNQKYLTICGDGYSYLYDIENSKNLFIAATADIYRPYMYTNNKRILLCGYGSGVDARLGISLKI